MPRLPSPSRPRLPSGARLAVDEWRAFGHRRFRTYQGIGVGSAAVVALAGDGLTIPLLLALGAPAAVATVIGVLPFTFSAAQLLVPSLLRRTDGNLRGVTIAILAFGETRGFVLAAVVLLHVAGVLPATPAIGAIAVVMCLGGAASAIGGANLLAWYGAILSESERRFVAPRVMGITQGLGAALLLPVALGVQAGLADRGPRDLRGRLPGGRAGRDRRAGRGGPPPPPRSGARRASRRAAAALARDAQLHPDRHPGRGRGRLRALPLHLRDQRPRRVGGLRHPPLGGLGRGGPRRRPRWSAGCSTAGPPRERCASRSSCAAGASSWGSSRSRAIRSLGSSSSASPSSSRRVPRPACSPSNERLLRLTGGVDLIGAQSRFVAGTAAGLTVGQLGSAERPRDPAGRLPDLRDPHDGLRAWCG